MNALSQAIESNAPKERQEELAQKVRDGFTRFDQMAQTEEQKRALFDRNADEMEKAARRLGEALKSPNSKFDPTPLYR
jgi:hypothetical protein